MTEPQERIWNERLGWLAADGTIEREVGKEDPLTVDEFNRRFEIVPTSLLGLPRDLSKAGPDAKMEGDCQTYGKTVKRIEGRFGIMIRCWSPQNWKPPFLPRHAVMWIKGKGFIDSTRREYRKTPWPHIPVWPVGTPALVMLAWVAKLWGIW